MRPAPLAACLALAAAPALALAAGVTSEDAGVYQTYTLDGGAGVRVTVTNYGARILRIDCPDRDGRVVNVALGHGPELTDWVEDIEAGRNPYFGAIVGRYANRIAGGRFSLDGKTYSLATNNGSNHLHGGRVGFDRVRWEKVSSGSSVFSTDESGTRTISPGATVLFAHRSPDGDEGYPGTLTATVRYSILESSGDTLRVTYTATTTASTVLNLTQHAYFNLKGEGAGDVLGHELEIDADRSTPVDETLIPTGELRPVAGTPLDFTTATPIGERIDADVPQLRLTGGYDQNYVLNGDRGGKEPTFAARVTEPLTGRVLEVATTEPGVQLYTAQGLNGSIVGTSGRPYTKYGGFCLETQHFPDSPNRPEFPSTTLRPGETFRSVTTYRFTTDTE